MAFGLAAPGRCSQSGKLRTLGEFRAIIRQIVEQELIDIALMSASTAELLVEENLFEKSAVTPAIRANDTTDIWLATGTGDYPKQPSLPFRSANLERISSVRLGLYSITMNNDAALDRATLEAYSAFRGEAAASGFRHFLEIFPPNAPGNNAPENVGQFICDTVVRTLAGLTRSERPQFLKIPYLGPELTERLVAYDPRTIVGIMGGASGTTFDAFELLASARKHGVRAALFGRRINNAEDQLAFVQHLRWIADGEIGAEEAVRSYHGALQEQGLPPVRSIEEDLAQTQTT